MDSDNFPKKSIDSANSVFSSASVSGKRVSSRFIFSTTASSSFGSLSPFLLLPSLLMASWFFISCLILSCWCLRIILMMLFFNALTGCFFSFTGLDESPLRFLRVDAVLLNKSGSMLITFWLDSFI